MIACIKSWVMQLLGNTLLLCGWGAWLVFPLGNKKLLEESTMEGWNLREWFCYKFILAENRENKLGNTTYFYLLLLKYSISLTLGHIVNQVHICCSISLTTFLPYEYMMASTHPTEAQCSHAPEYSPKPQRAVKVWGFPRFSPNFLDMCLSHLHCSIERKMPTCYNQVKGEQEDTAIQPS